MTKNLFKLRAVFAVLTICSILSGTMPVKAQDLIATSDITNGTSIFIFRQASNKQSKLSTKNFAQRPTAYRFAARQKTIARRNLAAANRSNQINKTNRNIVAKNKISVRKIPVNSAASKIKMSETFAADGENNLDAGDWMKAEANFKKSLEFNPANQKAKIGLSEAETRRADALDIDGNAAAAILVYRQAIALNAENAAAFGGLGDCLDETKDEDGALENYLKAMNLDASLEDYLTPAGIIYYRKGNYAQSEIYFNKTLAKNPQDVEVNYFLGLVKFKQNQNADAAKIFEKNIAANPKSAENYYYLGAVDDRLERTDDAIKQYQAAIKIDPNYADAWFDLGVIYYNQSKYSDAATAYGEAIRARNDFPAAHANLASALRQLKNYQQANAEYAAAETKIKDDPDLYSEWGYCLGKVNKWDKAAERIDSAVALNSEAFAYSNLGWVYYNSAQSDLMQNKTDAANAKLEKGKTALRKATEINADYEPAYLNLGVTLNGLKDFSGAISALTKANDLRHNWLPAINQLGAAYRKNGDLNSAVEQFQKAVGLDKNFAEGFYNLGEAQFRLGNKKEAKQTQQALQKIDPALAQKLNDVIAGKIINDAANKVQDEIQKKNPLKKLPKLPF